MRIALKSCQKAILCREKLCGGCLEDGLRCPCSLFLGFFGLVGILEGFYPDGKIDGRIGLSRISS